MLIEYNFKLSQLYYIRPIIVSTPDYRPDNRDAAWLDILIETSKAVRAKYLATFTVLALAQGTTRSATATLHDAAVGLYQCMKSCYRKDAICTDAIDNLPVQDKSVAETLERGQSLNKCWAGLPNPPEWTTPFKVGTMDRAAFEGMVNGLEGAIQAEANADQPFQLAEGAFRKQRQAMGDFISAALTQGRGQFAEGTPEREAIDRVPSATAQQLPGQAVIGEAESPAPGEAVLKFDADHATSFQVWHLAPGATEYELVADVIRPGVYVATGLTAGQHSYKVTGLNSRGEGPASEVVTVSVAAAVAA